MVLKPPTAELGHSGRGTQAPPKSSCLRMLADDSFSGCKGKDVQHHLQEEPNGIWFCLPGHHMSFFTSSVMASPSKAGKFPQPARFLVSVPNVSAPASGFQCLTCSSTAAPLHMNFFRNFLTHLTISAGDFVAVKLGDL